MCGAVANLCTNESERLRVVREGGLSALLAMAVHSDADVQCETARALRNICSHKENRMLVIGSGGFDVWLAS